MSKAFTSEENEDDFAIDLPALPAGTKNYMTPAGHARLKADWEKLLEQQTALRQGDMAAQAQAERIERRLQALKERLEAAHVIDPLTQPPDRVLFGATIDIVDSSGNDQSWRIVGLDETDIARGHISWMSPLAAAFLEKQPGEVVHFNGQRWTLRAVRYEA